MPKIFPRAFTLLTSKFFYVLSLLSSIARRAFFFHYLIFEIILKEFGLYVGITDFCYLLAKIGKIRFSQTDTERRVKTTRKVEPRFSQYNEVNEQRGRADRAKKEVFIHENY